MTTTPGPRPPVPASVLRTQRINQARRTAERPAADLATARIEDETARAQLAALEAEDQAARAVKA